MDHEGLEQLDRPSPWAVRTGSILELRAHHDHERPGVSNRFAAAGSDERPLFALNDVAE